MRPIVVRTSQAVPTSPTLLINSDGKPQISLQVVITGAATVVVEQTLDDPQWQTTPITWFPHPDPLLASTSVNAQGNYAFMPRAIRMRQTAGAGSATLTALQGGITG